MAAQHFTRSLQRAMEAILSPTAMCGSQEQALIEAMQLALVNGVASQANDARPMESGQAPSPRTTKRTKVLRQTPRPLSIFS